MAQTKLVPQAPPVLLLALGALTALLFPVHLYLIANAPVELQMGIVQKIFYFHVPSAYAMYVGFTLAMIGSVGYLWKRDARFDALAVAGAEVGLLFCVVVLITGPLWARNAWGTYWTWDPRLTTTLLAAMIFASFVALRSIGAAGEAEKRFASALGIVGFFLLPEINN
jgi:heme exporter protein C